MEKLDSVCSEVRGNFWTRLNAWLRSWIPSLDEVAVCGEVERRLDIGDRGLCPGLQGSEMEQRSGLVYL